MRREEVTFEFESNTALEIHIYYYSAVRGPGEGNKMVYSRGHLLKLILLTLRKSAPVFTVDTPPISSTSWYKLGNRTLLYLTFFY
jgi:hypothetical protein